MLDRKVYLNIDAGGFVTEVREADDRGTNQSRDEVSRKDSAENMQVDKLGDEGEEDDPTKIASQKSQVLMHRMTYMKLSQEK